MINIPSNAIIIINSRKYPNEFVTFSTIASVEERNDKFIFYVKDNAMPYHFIIHPNKMWSDYISIEYDGTEYSSIEDLRNIKILVDYYNSIKAIDNL